MGSRAALEASQVLATEQWGRPQLLGAQCCDRCLTAPVRASLACTTVEPDMLTRSRCPVRVYSTAVESGAVQQCGAVQSASFAPPGAGHLRLIVRDHRPYMVAIVSLIVQIIPVSNRCHSCVRAPDVSMGLSRTACQDGFVQRSLRCHCHLAN